MRVYLTRSLLRIVHGVDDTLNVRGRLDRPITQDIESRLQHLANEVMSQFNFFTTDSETIDYVSKPIVYMPDEFTFFVDVESIGRLGRELLIDMMPLYASTWESRHASVAELWVGGQGENISTEERGTLGKAMQEIWSMPVQHKVFVLDDVSFRSHARRVGTVDAIRKANGIVHDVPSRECDYYVTGREEAADAAIRAGAKKILDPLMLSVMLSGRV